MLFITIITSSLAWVMDVYVSIAIVHLIPLPYYLVFPMAAILLQVSIVQKPSTRGFIAMDKVRRYLKFGSIIVFSINNIQDFFMRSLDT
jgi:hypothetical protein